MAKSTTSTLSHISSRTPFSSGPLYVYINQSIHQKIFIILNPRDIISVETPAPPFILGPKMIFHIATQCVSCMCIRSLAKYCSTQKLKTDYTVLIIIAIIDQDPEATAPASPAHWYRNLPLLYMLHEHEGVQAKDSLLTL